MAASVKFFYDISSFPSWILFEHLFAAHRTTGLSVHLKPIRSAALYSMTGHKDPYYIVPFRNFIFKEVEQLSELFGVPAALPTDCEKRLSSPGTLRAQNFLAHVQIKHPECLEVASRLLWKRLWIQDLELQSEEDFHEVVREACLASNVPLSENFESLSQLKINETEAFNSGAYTTPFCIVDYEDETSSFHGVDRWPIIARKAGLDSPHRGFYSLKAFNHLFFKALETSD
ncbi:unnamed protein product [Bursaphelenchus xylophilus]|uniref:(pine wood nematode) hypothetical protein n=1 Tax=Bursaphelenchus xylophilus TaxID=6326 RepID=A0A1I7RPS5_BURXY|nr:unnamed protein product [Bursaphelenchus xylophilus]CAG9096534.1 unnamed protein product [Bursaphelenchus xylophilus]